jgi:plastocyanin
MTARFAAAVLIGSLSLVACASGDSSNASPGLTAAEVDGAATYEYTIPLGAGEALDAGTPLEVLPGELNTIVGETIRIVNEDDRGHNVGPWFVGANETLNQEFTSAGVFEGVCTVHPSGELILNVDEA